MESEAHGRPNELSKEDAETIGRLLPHLKGKLGSVSEADIDRIASTVVSQLEPKLAKRDPNVAKQIFAVVGGFVLGLVNSGVYDLLKAYLTTGHHLAFFGKDEERLREKMDTADEAAQRSLSRPSSVSPSMQSSINFLEQRGAIQQFRWQTWRNLTAQLKPVLGPDVEDGLSDYIAHLVEVQITDSPPQS